MSAANPFLAPARDPGRTGRSGGSSVRDHLAQAGEWLLVAVVALTGLSLIMDPQSRLWVGESLRLSTADSLAKRLLPVLGLGAATFLLVLSAGGMKVLRRSLDRLLPLPMAALALLAVWVLAGSVYSRISAGNADSFFVTGATMLAGLFGFWCCELCPDPARLMRRLLPALGFGALLVAASFVVTALDRDSGACELLPPVFLAGGLAWFLLPHPAFRVLVGLFVAGTCLVSLKKTGLIGAGLFAVPLVVDLVVRRFGATRRTGLVLAGCLVVVALAGLAGYKAMEDSFRSSDLSFREYQYEMAKKQFLDSPIWGELYSGSSKIRNAMWQNQEVATHNDFLDVLRQGGVIAMALFLVATLHPAWVLWRRRQHYLMAPPPLLGAMTSTIACFGAMAFNPVLLFTDAGAFFWLGVGIAAWHVLPFRTRVDQEETARWRNR